jgi:hypothetical protein
MAELGAAAAATNHLIDRYVHMDDLAPGTGAHIARLSINHGTEDELCEFARESDRTMF